jgi:glycerol-3-phosphate acyltransferase PlsY
LAAILISYLLGAIPFGLIISKAAGIEDIRKHGSGNIGATNVWRLAGAKVAIWVFILDIGKGAAAVTLGKLSYMIADGAFIGFETFVSICGLAAVLGHMYPVYLKFKGGKGVNTALGVFVTLLPLQTLMSFGAFVITLLLSRYVSLSSMIAAVTLSVILSVQKFVLHQSISDTYLAIAVLLAILVVIAHRKNISRLINGTESRFSLSGGSRAG